MKISDTQHQIRADSDLEIGQSMYSQSSTLHKLLESRAVTTNGKKIDHHY